ncbi:amidase signature domain-containing protein [Xylariaceae sp. FL0594]|nr:amidase signature domain-containing protein [Xylariaceae sp. FL0594]
MGTIEEPSSSSSSSASSSEGHTKEYIHKALDASAYGETYPSALSVAVPSRLRYHHHHTSRPFAGTRIAIKDNSTCAQRTADVVTRLLDLGFVVVGKTKTTQFADSEWPTCDYVDYHGPFNPRGDGYLTPSGSSSGSAVADAAYAGWLDFTLGSDTLGSIRSPAAAQGIYSMRPTVGAASFEGAIPYSPHWDTPAGFAHEAKSFARLASALYGDGSEAEYSSTCKKPTKLLLPTDYWPVADAQSQERFEALISKIEDYLGVSQTSINLADTWLASNPVNTTEAFESYFENVFAWSANPDQWNGFLKGFLEDYWHMFGGREAILHPQLRFKRYESFYEHVMPRSEDGCPTSLLVLPWTNGVPDYRDKYRDGPQRFTGIGFFFYNVGPYANAPEIMVPAGTTSYLSPRSGVEEQMPAGISIVASTGTDVMLARLVADMMDEEGEPRPFTQLFNMKTQG